jgi:hypothetical protein
MCLFLLLMFLGPRFGILVYWLGWPARWELAFDTAIVPIIGFFIAPWTTFMYVLVAPGGIETWDYLWLGLAVLTDLVTLSGGGRYGRQRRQMQQPVY